ncbi:hypothetical protein DSM104299_03090 [Baekduia alba]|uniref:hypothetical protein n=1 Tax=Baekduia alba TaxID=2997333 RepID=UPI00233FCF82|nr:hypothetical protein [Baekduia alba]WCB94356.1 hypothetical protein DSM104299_03090 [Baekduia alba]
MNCRRGDRRGFRRPPAGRGSEDVDAPGFHTVDGIAHVEGEDPSKRSTGERAAWLGDSEGNLRHVGQPV